VAQDAAVTPAPNPDPDWLARAQAVLQAPRGNPRVIFLGDSITEFFADGSGAAVWRRRIAPRGADDLALRGSATQNLLYELDRGLLGGLRPRLVVLMIGTNNLRDGDTPGQTATGVAACLADIRGQLPQARILLLGLLPAGGSPSDPLRAAVGQTNALLAGLADGKVVHYTDVGGPFLQRDGTFVPGMMLDDFHPSEVGYRSIARGLEAMLSALAHDPPLPPPGGGRP
jgi:lysophospholipase L1-like esterase